MRALILGASGQVGGHLLTRCRAQGAECLGTSFRHGRADLLALDLRDGPGIFRLIRYFRPEVVYLPAALTFMDYAEMHAEECQDVNVRGTVHVAEAVRRWAGRLVLFSTDHVFADGVGPYGEDDPVCPRSVYARTKAAAEQYARELLPDRHLILRTSWVFGPEAQRKNFVYRVLATLGHGETLAVPDDQHGSPTYGPDLAAAAVELVCRRASGTYHAVGPVQLSRLEFACLVARVFDLDERAIRGVPTASLPSGAPRPLRVALRRDRLLAALGSDPIRNPCAALIHMRIYTQSLAA
jgi:dTDP-4-dehydrorhamnose reductase